MRISQSLLVLTVSLLSLLGGCDRPFQPELPEVAVISFARDLLEVASGQTLQMDVDVRDGDQQPMSGVLLNWESSDTTVVAISSSGVLTAKVPGSATVKAWQNGVHAQMPVVVHGAGFHLWPDTVSMLPGDMQQLLPRAFNHLGWARVLSGSVWETSNPDVAVVDASGLVTAVGPGRVTVTAILGDVKISSDVSVLTPEQPLRFTSLTGGDYRQTCGLTADGQAYCWGPYLDEVGLDEPADRCEYFAPNSNSTARQWTRRCSDIPVRTGRGLRFASISADHQICGITHSGALHCWSKDTLPTQLATGVGFRSVSVGEVASSCAVSTSNQAYCWGHNTYGQLGNGTTTATTVPTPVSGGLEFRTVEVGDFHACGLTTAGDAYCWGHGDSGELGVAARAPSCPSSTRKCSTTPLPVEGNVKFKALDVGDSFSCGLDLDGRAHCWGVSSLVPTPVVGGFTFNRLSVNSRFACAIDADGAVYCWSRGSASAPSRVSSLPGPMLLIHPGTLRSGIRDDGISVEETQYCGMGLDSFIRCGPIELKAVRGQ